VIHIKRFKYNSTRREKLSTDVHFPLAGLDLSPYVSRDLASLLGANEAPAGTASVRKPPLYDLIGVSNHHGSLHSGHYIAHVDTTGGRPDKARRWMCFNDSRVSAANASGIAGPTAYVLFYKLHEQSAV
jgi:ubiquitin C-terminal hydrolase